LRDKIQAAARHDANVLFTGEPGSGRSLSARYFASVSRRAAEPFEVVVAAGLTDAAAEGVLLGEGGKGGALERASGGILYLSGIEELSLRVQGLLMRALTKEGEFQSSDHHDIRVLASAPSGFERDGKFLPALLGLIGTVVVRVPELREHAEDVPELLRFYVDTFVDRARLPFRRFSIAAQNRLRNYPWPGNVRELEQLVKQLLVLGGEEDIELAEVEAELAVETADSEPLIKQDLLAMPLREAREHFERAYLKQQLQLCGGKVGKLAKRVGMERTHLYRKLRALGVDFRQSVQED
jgi:DNA-binding NtrC family response regulator